MTLGAPSWDPRRRRRAVVGVLVAVLLVGSFAAGYVIASDSETDLNAVERAASEAGREAGLRKGAKEGYARGFKEARQRNYRPTYVAAYRAAYSREFELVGLDPPERIPIPERQ